MNARGGSQPQSLRSMNASMNSPFPNSQPGSRQTSRLQNTQKTGLGNGNAGAGWAFGAPSSGAGAFGGLGGAPGLGQARPPHLSGFAQVMGGGGQPQIDLAEFPSLAGGSRPQQNNSSGWNSNVLRQQPPPPQAASQQSQPRAPSTAPSHQSLEQFDNHGSQQQPLDPGGSASEEFQSSANGDSSRQSNGFGSASLSSPDPQHPQPNGQQTQLPIRDSSNNSNFPPNQQAPIGTNQSTTAPQPQHQALPQQEQRIPIAQPNPSVKRWADQTEQERWGMLGLAGRLEYRRAVEAGEPVDETLPPSERNAAMLMGQDLNTLGMDLESPDPLYPTFSPWPTRDSSGSVYDYKDRFPVPAFHVPAAYTVNNVPPMSSRMGVFSDETLFQIFFTKVRDIQQEQAAIELSVRDWRWHKVLRQWLQKDTREAQGGTSLPLHDLAPTIPVGQPAVRIDDRSERGVYIFLDHNNWRRERREFQLDYDSLDHRNGPSMAAGSAAHHAANMTGTAFLGGVGPQRQGSGMSGPSGSA